jgi:DNA polymerase-3 subunit delta'
MLIGETGIIGHEKVISFFEQALSNDHLAQAYLLVGPRGVGKTTVVEWLIKKLIGPTGWQHPDVITLSRLVDEKTEKIKSEIVVSQVREMRGRLAMSGLNGSHKIAFIEEAETLNSEAANALLKTLEEPTPGTVLLLRATSPDQVLPTITSRCQIIRFFPVDKKNISEALVNRGVNREEAENLASLSAGCPGYALRLLRDEETRSQEEVFLARFLESLAAPLSSRLLLAAAWLPKDENNKVEQLKDLLDRWEVLLREALLFSAGLSNVSPRVKANSNLQKFISQKSCGHWLKVLETLRLIKNDLSSHLNPGLALERLLLVL